MEQIYTKILCAAVFFQSLKLSTSWCNWIGCDCQPCSNSTNLGPCFCLTTQGITNSESPPISNLKIEDTPICSVGSIVGAVIAGALFGSVVIATVFVCIHRRFSFCPRQIATYRKKEEHNLVFRMQGGLILENPKEETVEENPVYDDIPDETQKGHSPQSIHHQGDSERREHFHQTTNLNTRCSDEYDHTGPQITVNDGLNIVSNEKERKEIPDHIEKAESLQTQQHQEKSGEKSFPESAELDRNASENYDHTVSATVVKDVHDMLSNDGKNEETFFEADPKLLPEFMDSGNVQISQYFSLETQ